MTDLIVLVGGAGVGKTLAAESIALRLNRQILTFDAPIEAMLAQFMKVSPREVLESQRVAPNEVYAALENRTIQHAVDTLRGWGTMELGHKVWANRMRNTVEESRRYGLSVVVDGCDTHVGYQTLKGIGAKVVRVSRPGHVPRRSNGDWPYFDLDGEATNDALTAELWLEGAAAAIEKALS